MLIFRSRLCVVVAALICTLCGCSKETPRKVGPRLAETGGPSAISDRDARLQTGAELFRQFCHNCHPDGGNVSDPERPLYGSFLRKNHITTPEDIVKIMRNPLSRMIRFDVKTISNKDARAIAEYVLNTYR